MALCKYILKNCLFLEILAWLLNIIYRPFCEHFRVGTISFLPNYLHRLHHHTKGSVQLFTDDRLELLLAPDVNCPRPLQSFNDSKLS